MSGRLADSGSYSITYNVPYWFKRMGMRYSRKMELTQCKKDQDEKEQRKRSHEDEDQSDQYGFLHEQEK